MKRFSKLCILFLMIFSFATTSMPYTADAASQKSSLNTERADLEKKLADIDKKINSLNSESKETKEYLAVLDEKIGYLNEQYNLTKTEISDIENKVDSLEKSIDASNMEIGNINIQIDYAKKKIDKLNMDFEDTYDEFCQRMRALYISGNGTGTLSFLLSSDGLAQLYTRYEMIASVSKCDGALMKEVKTQCDQIISTSNLLKEKQTKLDASVKKLNGDKASLKTEKVDLLKKQESLEGQDKEIKAQQKEANALLIDLDSKSKEYGEFRDITQKELDEIDADIAEADKKYPIKPTTTKTTTKKSTTQKPSTTKKQTTTKHTQSSTTKHTTTKKQTTTKKHTTTKKTTTAPSSQYLSLTYPCPRYTKITCAFGAYSGHSGCDFSTYGHENQKIVAAESGTVILVKLLERSYGHYIVIRHDKTTKDGKIAYTLYAHNNDIIVSEGQHVSKGQQIAYSGTTGNSTGPHCHFELRLGGSSQSYAVNPARYLP